MTIGRLGCLFGGCCAGLLFLAGLSAYTFGCQLLSPLRGIPRRTVHGRTVTMVVTGLIVAGAALVLLLT